MKYGMIVTGVGGAGGAAGGDGVFTWDGICVGETDTYDPWVISFIMAKDHASIL